MSAPLKIIVAFIFTLLTSSASAFVAPGTRPVVTSASPGTRVGFSSSTSALFMEAPTIDRKTKDNTSEQQEKGKEWQVRLWNDPMNKREYVARCLIEICSLEDGMAYSVMMHAHQNGMAVIGQYQKEIAEGYTSELTQHGLTVDMAQAE
mmetsp:Transcript_21072/g.43364  ORF Transcript_21072/g.43364 Transcript_21072/m.43364 type:complete len:149 (+) Transcript_21072:121-567(+)